MRIILIMEVMEGGELFERIIKKTSFSECEASSLLYEVIQEYIYVCVCVCVRVVVFV